MSFRSAWVVGRVRGIPIRLHVSLAFIIPFLSVVFAHPFRDSAGAAVATVMGLGVAIALFASVLVHEIAHGLTALRLGGRVRSITLMFLGGISELEGALPPRCEALVAIVGPLASLAIGGLLLGVAGWVGAAADPVQLVGALNVVLGAFNLVPAFPLDGGRLVRALLALRYGRPRATRVAGKVGQALAVVIGALGALSGDVMLLLVAAFIYVGAEREAGAVGLDEDQTAVSQSG
jgi:Zn-dependent protease